MHTCPAQPGPHPVDTIGTVLQTIPSRRCTRPITATCGNVTAVVACGRHEQYERQCRNCRIVITHPMGLIP
jgi:hypothetical protein